MGILINTGFDVGSSSPIDNRTIKNTIDERDALVSEGKVYENLKVYCKDTKKEYRWTGTEWEISLNGSGDLTDYQKKTDDTLTTTNKTVVGGINEIYGTQLDTVDFSADYKNIILNRKNGLNPYTIPISAIINNASLTELKDIDSTDIGNGKTLVYDSATQKHKYVDTELTDELVKMEASSDSEYLADLIDKNTIVNDKGVLKVKKLDGQEVTIAEINYLKGLTMNIVDLVKSFSNGGVKMYEHTIATYADLLALDRSEFVDGIRYFVYVLADETHGGIKTTYICDKTNTSYFGVAGDDRDFTTEPIDLANEVTGKLGASNIDVDALWKLVTVYDTYKTLTTKNEPFGTHGANAMYNELVAEIGKKSNTSDLTKHTDDTNIHVTASDKSRWNNVFNKVNITDFLNHTNNTDIHITSAERTKWNNVDNKVGKTDITTTIDSSSTDSQVPTAKSVYDNSLTKGMGEGNTVIPDGSDLNDYLTPGVYTCFSSVSAETLSNCPHKESNFKLFVNKITGETTGFYGYQIIVGSKFSIMLKPCVYYRSVLGDKNNLTYSKWQRLCGTSVADVEKTDITSKVSNATVNTGYGVSYSVKNGICYVQFTSVTVRASSNGQYIILKGTLPAIDDSLTNGRYPVVGGGSKIGMVAVDGNTGGIKYYGGDMTIFTTISYPVAEQ